jgi:hypothetical protein
MVRDVRTTLVLFEQIHGQEAADALEQDLVLNLAVAMEKTTSKKHARNVLRFVAKKL